MKSLRRWVKAAIMGLSVALVGAIVAPTPLAWELEETIGLDWLFAWRGSRPAPPEVVIVTLDGPSAHLLKLPDDPRRWSRALHGRLIDQLERAGATAIGFDIMFDGFRAPEEDRIFASAIARAGNVVLFESLNKKTLQVPAGEFVLERLVPPPASFAKGAAALAPFPLPKVPAKVDRVWNFKSEAGDAPTFPVVMLQLYSLGVYDELRERLLALRPALDLPATAAEVLDTHGVVNLIYRLRRIFSSDTRLASELLSRIENVPPYPTHADGRLLRALVRLYQGGNSFYLNFYGPPRSITMIPYHRALGDGVPNVDLRGKAVFVGFAAAEQPTQKDGFYTVYSLASGLDISGVELAATAFGNLIEDLPVRPLSFSEQISVLVLWGLLIGAILRAAPVPLAVLSCLSAVAVYVALAQAEFNSKAVWFPLVTPLLLQAPLALFVAIFWRYADANQERRQIRRAFGYYLPVGAIDEIVKSVGDVAARGKVVYGICLSTDASQYTALAERMDPRELGALLNDYYGAMFARVKARGGIVSDVVGDAMFAVWTAPQPDVALRRAACLAACEIRRAAALPTRIGVHAGQILLGNIGAGERYEYRAVGDVANTTTRIQELNKVLGTHVIASREGICDVADLAARELGTFLLAGKSSHLCMYELLSEFDVQEDGMRRLCADFAEGLQMFRAQRWAEAETVFSRLEQAHPEDGPSHFYASLVRQYSAQRPAADWAGTIIISKDGKASIGGL